MGEKVAHVFKVWSSEFKQIEAGRHFSIIKTRNDLEVGELIMLKEFFHELGEKRGEFSGNDIVCRTSYKDTSSEGLVAGFMLIGFSDVRRAR